MVKLDLSYLQLPDYPVADKNEFYRSGVQEVNNIRSLIAAVKRLFVVPENGITLNILGEERLGYRIDIQDVYKKRYIGKIYYILKGKYFDVYDENNEDFPLIAFRNKKCVQNSSSLLLERLGLEGLFAQLVAFS